jgi:hypothetical protein
MIPVPLIIFAGIVFIFAIVLNKTSYGFKPRKSQWGLWYGRRIGFGHFIFTIFIQWF